ncbi:tyrosine--tRNA ligase [Amphiplicatus metriothermophilus]|uniref:Tyrosine--tRNA ligase n=1 Tax=Amphiplicatus metriothermophilus TaxID=1519374 RepID=A0A239Q086_9PROT|nr:tyrosine--tRNA ligase [Amphiplicatus metriothermophilus]MBB5520174.1 tyrosyl-tRNA synthetase [Amphiplicatus metriothermophilus]SNT75915.1 tyrosyl-tRNA synthetase [Amphiplicatus metriothermophilus]
MSAYKSDFLAVLDERGFIHQGTNLEGLDALAARQAVTGYIGFDATAPSLHAGGLIQIMTLYWLQQTGHRPIALMGGGTTKVGDPAGKDAQRALLSEAEIAANITSIKGVFEKFLTFGDGPTDAVMVDNDEWLSELGYIDFLRDYGVHFTINRMLTFDSVKLRLERESPMTFLEFNYMLMQAYDFHELYNRYGCLLQLGGSDQWGNIVNGVELIRRKDGVEAFGLTTPLLTTASGRKMGKTESGAVWLNADMFSPYDYWQYWRNVEDADVGRMLALFTTLPMEDVRRLSALGGAEINEAKKILATEATALVHGRAAADAAAETARRAFEEGAAAEGLPSVAVPRARLKAGLSPFEPLQATKLIASNGEGRRHIKAGALRVNDVPLTEERPLTEADVRDGVIKLSVGRKKHALVRVE